MAKSRIFVMNGSISPPTGFNMDFQTMRIHEMQTSENITSYGGTIYGIFFGSGTTIQDIAVTGYPFKGTTASNPGIGNMNGTAGALGSSATYTLDTGITISGAFLSDDLTIDHSRLVAGAKTSMGFKPAGELTIAWASS